MLTAAQNFTFGPETAILISATISGKIRCVKFCGAVSRVSTTARASENSNPIAKNTRFHASARARPGLFRLSKILCRGQHFLAQQRAHQRIQTQSLHTLDFMQVRVRGLGSHARHATPRGGAAPPRRGAGDGDGLLADGRTPVECRAHRVLFERRQRHAARVETVGRGAPVGTGVALRPPFTPRKIAAKSSSDRAAAPPAERNP